MPDGNLSIIINAPAPKFSLIDIFDREINLEDYKEKKCSSPFSGMLAVRIATPGYTVCRRNMKI